MADQWFYARGGQQQGPVTFAQLSELARTGAIGSADLVWQEGMPDWQPAGQVPALFAAPTGGYAPPPAPAAPAPMRQGPAAGPISPVPAQPVGYQAPYQPQYQAHPPGSVPNYLVQSILVTIFCCWPFGIPAIVYAAQVNSKLAQGDYQGAVAASNSAKMWSWISFGLGFGFAAIYLILIIIGAASS